MVVGKRQTAWPAARVSKASAGGWRWRRRARESAAGFSRRALTFAFGAGSKFRMQAEERGRGWSLLTEPEAARTARNGRQIGLGKTGT